MNRNTVLILILVVLLIAFPLCCSASAPEQTDPGYIVKEYAENQDEVADASLPDNNTWLDSILNNPNLPLIVALALTTVAIVIFLLVYANHKRRSPKPNTQEEEPASSTTAETAAQSFDATPEDAVSASPTTSEELAASLPPTEEILAPIVVEEIEVQQTDVVLSAQPAEDVLAIADIPAPEDNSTHSTAQAAPDVAAPTDELPLFSAGPIIPPFELEDVAPDPALSATDQAEPKLPPVGAAEEPHSPAPSDAGIATVEAESGANDPVAAPQAVTPAEDEPDLPLFHAGPIIPPLIEPAPAQESTADASAPARTPVSLQGEKPFSQHYDPKYEESIARYTQQPGQAVNDISRHTRVGFAENTLYDLVAISDATAKPKPSVPRQSVGSRMALHSRKKR